MHGEGSLGSLSRERVDEQALTHPQHTRFSGVAMRWDILRQVRGTETDAERQDSHVLMLTTD
jgi:hypothetical protein